MTKGDKITDYVPLAERPLRDQINEAFILLTSLAAVDHLPSPPTEIPSLLTSYVSSSPSRLLTLRRLTGLILSTTLSTYSQLRPRDIRARHVAQTVLRTALSSPSINLSKESIDELFRLYLTDWVSTQEAEVEEEERWDWNDIPESEARVIAREFGEGLGEAWEEANQVEMGRRREWRA